MADPFYITTAIAYPNGKPHIGHAYEAIAADVIARHQRSEGRNVRFQTGTDEHGLKMAQKARDLGITPRALCDEMSGHFRSMCDTLNISYDVFQRTTDDAHYKASQAIWQAMEANGDLYLDRYEGWYSVRDEAFYDESELVAGEGARSCLLRERRWNGPLRKAGSSASRPIRSPCWPIMPPIRSSSAPKAAAMRW
jgi:methionyl-tRNA synthetase